MDAYQKMKTNLLAQSVTIQGMNIKGPLVGINNIGDVLNKILPFITSVAGVILFFILVWGGLDVMMAQGSPDKIKSGRAKITAGVIGFVLLVMSYLITKIIAYIFNIGQGVLQ